MKKINKFLTKYDTHIYAFLLTSIFVGLFTLTLLEVINQAFA